MNYSFWHKNILCKCKELIIIDRDCALCKANGKRYCDFWDCIKIPKEDKIRNYD